MTDHRIAFDGIAPQIVDPSDRIDADDLACWLLFFLEAHGAAITLRADGSLRVDLNTMLGLDLTTAERWVPVLVRAWPQFLDILIARRAAELASTNAR